MQQTFPVNKEPRVVIERVEGDLIVSAWDGGSISIESGGDFSRLYQEGNSLFINDCGDDLVLRVPADTEIRAEMVEGDVSIKQVRRVALHVLSGDVVLERIGEGVDVELIGEAIEIANVSGDLVVRDSSSLRAREGVEGDASISNVALIEMERVEGDISIQHTDAAVIGTVGSDLSVTDVATELSCGNVGGDCSVSGGGQGECTIGNVGGDLSLTGLATVRIGSVGGDCSLRDAQGDVEFGNVGSDASFHTIGGRVHMGNVGGDASFKALLGSVEAGNIGGDLLLEASFPAGSSTRMHVGGDAVVRLPAQPDLAIRAFAGGDIAGAQTASSGGNSWVNLVYGSGSAQLELHVGGDLTLRGGAQPGSSSSSSGWSKQGTQGNWQSELERDMAELGREMSKLGQELSREITGAFRDASWAKGSEWANAFSDKMADQVRRAQQKAEEQARKAQERARKAQEHQEHHERVRVRFNDREWQFDPERLDRLKEQAARAANEGISGALDAVERAVRNLRTPPPPRSPMTPPAPPLPPVPPVPPVPPTPGQGTALAQDTPPASTGEQGTQDAPEFRARPGTGARSYPAHDRRRPHLSRRRRHAARRVGGIKATSLQTEGQCHHTCRVVSLLHLAIVLALAFCVNPYIL